MNTDQLIKQLEAKAESFRTMKEDPHNINTAVYVALLEVAEAVRRSDDVLRPERVDPVV